MHLGRFRKPAQQGAAAEEEEEEEGVVKPVYLAFKNTDPNAAGASAAGVVTHMSEYQVTQDMAKERKFVFYVNPEYVAPVQPNADFQYTAYLCGNTRYFVTNEVNRSKEGDKAFRLSTVRAVAEDGRDIPGGFNIGDIEVLINPKDDVLFRDSFSITAAEANRLYLQTQQKARLKNYDTYIPMLVVVQLLHNTATRYRMIFLLPDIHKFNTEMEMRHFCANGPLKYLKGKDMIDISNESGIQLCALRAEEAKQAV